ncbi:HNH endonuclease [Stakelama sp. CBK3Z-3]|uniref:HNH endonuclease n=1 Tax=Stakelama flava TaxID=2860338 RepID=A0ABS6XIK0_9SPHN|nr:HNH endonuclease signature motif containing protein [Stakelama flava]MBW4330044.1 HNH endonuclease [Stakelama flava]
MTRRADSRSATGRASQKLYKTHRWQKHRAAHIAANPLCVMCLGEGKTRSGRVADHVKPHGGDETLFFGSELQTLCDHHHNSLKQSQEKGGRIRGCDGDGFPVDPNHPWNTS